MRPFTAVWKEEHRSRLRSPSGSRRCSVAGGKEPDLQVFSNITASFESGRDGKAEVLSGAVTDNKNPRFAGIAFVLKPSPGLEPGTASLPWRFRIATGVGRNRSCEAVLPAISAIQALRLTFLGDP
jgi:hypothetical protein